MFLNDIDPDARTRRARVALRDRPEQVVRLAQHLPTLERRLIEQHLMDGLAVADLARLYREHPRTTRRRIERLVTRMHSPEFRLTVLHPDLLPRELRRVAQLLFVQGRSLRETARLTRRTLHRIRNQRTAIQALAQMHDQAIAARYDTRQHAAS
ncbi:MAG: hypothetical protein AAGC44_01970 [Planctomycetota bacterium]